MIPKKKRGEIRCGKVRNRARSSGARLDALIAEATVDAHDDDEQRMGFYNCIEEGLAVPFSTKILGVDVVVGTVTESESGEIVAVCSRGGKRQRIPILDLPLPRPRPKGWEWIEAYRRWCE